MKNQDQVRINERIRISPVLVIKDGENLGSMSVSSAITLARNEGLDLVEVSPNARPPVCRIIDYGKFKYDLEKKNRQKVSNNALKVIKLRPVTSEHDLSYRIENIKGFLEDGHNVQILIKFKRMEMRHKDLGFAVANGIIEKVSQVGQAQSKPTMNGLLLTCTLVPKTHVVSN